MTMQETPDGKIPLTQPGLYDLPESQDAARDVVRGLVGIIKDFSLHQAEQHWWDMLARKAQTPEEKLACQWMIHEIAFSRGLMAWQVGQAVVAENRERSAEESAAQRRKAELARWA